MDSFAPWAAEPWATLPAEQSDAAVAVRPVRVQGDQPLAAVLLLGLLLIGVVKSAIKAIYTAVLYRYAAEGSAPQGFDAQQLSLAFGAR
jgi:hypothetical protein